MGARMIQFGGWDMPLEYSGIVKEHQAVRNAAGLFDISHMGEFEVSGPEALGLIQFVTSNDAARLADGQAQYSALPTPDGTVVDDLLVYRFSQDRYMLVVNAANTQRDFEWIASHNRFNARIADVTDKTALLSLQGPLAAGILGPLVDAALPALDPFHFTHAKILGFDAVLSRTGYTGEDGFEIYLPSEHSEAVWTGLLDAGRPSGLLPAGLGARNTLRLEAKMLLYGNDMDLTTTLLEAGLGWIVKLDKGEFLGRAALQKQKAEGVKRILAGFEMLGRDIARDGYPVRIGGREVGCVTSGAPSITLKKNIGLTYLPVEHAVIGSKFEVSIRGRDCGAQVVPTPFYKRR